jgi:hypothetical protein
MSCKTWNFEAKLKGWGGGEQLRLLNYMKLLEAPRKKQIKSSELRMVFDTSVKKVLEPTIRIVLFSLKNYPCVIFWYCMLQ